MVSDWLDLSRVVCWFLCCWFIGWSNLLICLSVHPFVHSFMHSFVCPSLCLSVCPSVCLSVHLFVCLLVGWSRLIDPYGRLLLCGSVVVCPCCWCCCCLFCVVLSCFCLLLCCYLVVVVGVSCSPGGFQRQSHKGPVDTLFQVTLCLASPLSFHIAAKGRMESK